MKRLFILALSSILCLSAPAQEQALEAPKAKKGTFEAGVNLYSFTLRPGNFYSHYTPIYDHQVFSGLYLKYHVKKNAFRWEFNYSQRNFRFKNNSYGLVNGQLPVRSIEIKTGYQRTFINKRISFYGFADIEYNHFKSFPAYVNYPSIYNNMDLLYAPYSPGYQISASYFCVTPGLGLRWKIGKHLALGLESSAQFFYASENGTYMFSGGTGQKQRHALGINARPARITIGFIF